jgi:hypothetical protein
MAQPTDVLDTTASGQSAPLFQWFNPLAMPATIARCTQYRARRGAQPMHGTRQDAEAYEVGWDEWPKPPNLTARAVQWDAFFDREAAERGAR